MRKEKQSESSCHALPGTKPDRGMLGWAQGELPPFSLTLLFSWSLVGPWSRSRSPASRWWAPGWGRAKLIPGQLYLHILNVRLRHLKSTCLPATASVVFLFQENLGPELLDVSRPLRFVSRPSSIHYHLRLMGYHVPAQLLLFAGSRSAPTVLACAASGFPSPWPVSRAMGGLILSRIPPSWRSRFLPQSHAEPPDGSPPQSWSTRLTTGSSL